MLFKDIKQNYPVFILDKQEFKLINGKVTAVGFPRFEMNPKTGKSDMVVDVTIEAEGKSGTYVIPESSSVTCAGNLVLSTTANGLTSEIEALVNSANQALSLVPYYNKIKESAPTMLAELNPEYKAKQETDKRFSTIETSISEMKDLMSKQQEMITNFIKKFES